MLAGEGPSGARLRRNAYTSPEIWLRLPRENAANSWAEWVANNPFWLDSR